MTEETHAEREPLETPDSPPDAGEEATAGDELEDPSRDDQPAPGETEVPATMPPDPPTSG